MVASKRNLIMINKYRERTNIDRILYLPSGESLSKTQLKCSDMVIDFDMHIYAHILLFFFKVKFSINTFQ